MSIIERLRLIRSKDKQGNQYLDYPVTTIAAVKGLKKALADKAEKTDLDNVLVLGSQTTTSSADGGDNVYTFTDKSGKTSTLNVKNGNKGSTGNGISSIEIRYAASSSNTTTPSTWYTNVQSAAAGAYLWTRVRLYYTNGTYSSPYYTVAKQGETGAKGDKGDKGATGDKGETGAAATYVIAASDSVKKDAADYICTGTNDQNTIQSAINALPSGGGKIVLLEGTYTMSGGFTANKANVTIEGMGIGTTTLDLANDSDYLWSVIPISIVSANVNVKNLSIARSVKGGNGIGVWLRDDAKNSLIQNVEISNLEAMGIYTNSGDGGHIFDRVLVNNCNYGIEMRVPNCTAQKCVVKNSGDCAIYLGQSDITIIDCTCDTAGHDAIVCNDPRCTIIGNKVYNSGYSTIYLNPRANHCVVEGNICVNHGTQGIATDGSYNLISGNIAYRGNGTSSDYTSSQNPLNINGSNNFVEGNFTPGKNYSDGGSNNTFANNKY